MDTDKCDELLAIIERHADPLGLYLGDSVFSVVPDGPADLTATFTLGDRSMRPVVQDPEQDTYDRALRSIQAAEDELGVADLLHNLFGAEDEDED